MGVPEHIRAVVRPKNTVVIDTGCDSLKRYAVRERPDGKRKVAGGNYLPRNGRIVGHIVDGKFVPKNGTERENKDLALSYGAAAFARSMSEDLLDDLLQTFDVRQACTIMAIATLRVIDPGVPCRGLARAYRSTFVSVFYPHVAISASTAGTFLESLGRNLGAQRAFYHLRLERVSRDHHIAIDGMLKQDTGTRNDLSAITTRSPVRGLPQISLLYAYDIELMEPVCAEAFPGNFNDSSAYGAFVRDNDIRKGILVDDRGFPVSMIEAELRDRPDLHFMTPLKRNDTRIRDNNMLAFEHVMEGFGEPVAYKKEVLRGGRCLYSFFALDRHATEIGSYLRQKIKNGGDVDAKFSQKLEKAGVIVFLSDLDTDPATIYRCYADRWKLELVFKSYKTFELLDLTRVQSDFSIAGSEFINFISTTITCRLVNKARDAQLLTDRSFSRLMAQLSTAWRIVDSPEDPAHDDGAWVHTLKYVHEELEALGLSKPLPKPEPKKRGRPKKKKEEVDPGINESWRSSQL